MKRYKEIKEFSDTDLQSRLDEQQAHLKSLKISHSTTPVDNPLEIRLVRRQIARIKTEIKSRNTAA